LKIDISHNDELASLCDAMVGQPYFTFDTEFIRERTYFPALALIQVSWEGQDPVLIDPLTITNWSPFHALLADPDMVKVLHAGRQDLEIFYYQMETVPEPVFDTQIAASFCGLGDQISYSGLVQKLLGVHIPKGDSFTNWLQRPLTKDQIRYAQDDVRYLPEVYHELVKRAERKNRLSVIQEETDMSFHPELFDPDPSTLWRKVKKSGSLRSKDLAVLQDLAAWRDRTARELDKPVRYVLADEVLIDLSKIAQLKLEQLRARRGVHGKFIDRFGKAILDCHAQARQRPSKTWPKPNRGTRPTFEESENLADLAWILIREVARNRDISPNHLILKRDLAPLIDAYLEGKSMQGHPLFQGWRKDMVGKPLIDFIEGRLQIRVINHRIVWQPQAEKEES